MSWKVVNRYKFSDDKNFGGVLVLMTSSVNALFLRREATAGNTFSFVDYAHTCHEFLGSKHGNVGSMKHENQFKFFDFILEDREVASPFLLGRIFHYFR